MPTKRTKRIVIRASAKEHAALTAKATAAGTTVSGLLRDHLDRLRVYNHADRESWLRAITAMHQTAATMARAAVALKAADTVATLAYLSAANRQLGELIALESTHARKVFPSRNRRG